MLRLVLYILVIYLVNEYLTLVILAIYMPANHSWLLFLCLWCEWYNMGGRRMVIGVCDFCWSLKQSINPSILSHFCILYRVLVVVNFSWYGWSGQKTEENKLFYVVPNSLVSWVCSVNLPGWLLMLTWDIIIIESNRHPFLVAFSIYLLPMISIYRKTK